MWRHTFVIAAVGMLIAGAACGGSEEATSSTTAAPTSTAASATTVAGADETTVESDLEYSTFDGMPLTLDLYLPSEPTGAPVLVTEGFQEIERLVDEGMIVVNVDDFEPPIEPAGPDQPEFRASARASAEAFACAIRFARQQASDFGTDDPTVVLMSLSVGGGLVSHVALFGAEFDDAWDEFGDVGGPPRQVECSATGGSTAVDGLVGVAGAYDLFVPVFEGRFGRTYQQEQDPELQEFLASAVGTNTDMVVRLLHDPNEETIPLENSTMFAAELEEAGYDVEVIAFDGGHSYPSAELMIPILKEVIGH